MMLPFALAFIIASTTICPVVADNLACAKFACCIGVNKLTYQAPLNAGIDLSSLAQQFTVFDVFGPEACKSVSTKANSLGVTAVLIGSDGLNLCTNSALASATAANTFALAPQTEPNTLLYNNSQLDATVQLYDPYNEFTAEAVEEASEILIQSALILKSLAESAQAFALNAQSEIYAAQLLQLSLLIIQKSNELINLVTTLNPPPSIPEVTARQEQISQAVTAAGTVSTLLLEYTVSNANIPYGTFYTVSRTWSLNRPVYSIFNGLVSAANSLYNCEAEYRAVYLTKPINELTFTTNRCCDRVKCT